MQGGNKAVPSSFLLAHPLAIVPTPHNTIHYEYLRFVCLSKSTADPRFIRMEIFFGDVETHKNTYVCTSVRMLAVEPALIKSKPKRETLC